MATGDDNVPEKASVVEVSSKPMAGQRLAEARRSRDVSIAEIAKQLHIDEHKVQALEENQFDVLGAPVFAKGHLRKYAELLGVPVDDVLTDYYKLNRASGAPPLVARVRPRQSNVSLRPWLVWLALLAFGGLVIFAWMSWDHSPELVQTPGVLEPFADKGADKGADEGAGDEIPTERGNTNNESAGEPDAAATTVAGTENAPTESAAAPPATSPAPTASSTVAATPGAAGEVNLVMTFSGDCWTEVTDADGRRLYFGLGEAGRTISRAGKAPLRALFGDRNNVTVTVNGQALVLTGDGRRGNTARVTIDAP